MAQGKRKKIIGLSPKSIYDNRFGLIIDQGDVSCIYDIDLQPCVTMYLGARRLAEAYFEGKEGLADLKKMVNALNMGIAELEKAISEYDKDVKKVKKTKKGAKK